MAPAALEETITALNTEQERQTFEVGEEEYEHLLIDLKALCLGLDHLPVQEDQTMFDPGEESEAHGALDSMMKGEEKVGVPRSLLALKDMDWDDNVCYGMEWAEAETLCPAPTIWEGRLCQTPPSWGGVVCPPPSCEGGVMYNSSYSGGVVVCPDPSSGGEVVFPAPPNRGKVQRTVDLMGATMKGMRQAKGNL